MELKRGKVRLCGICNRHTTKPQYGGVKKAGEFRRNKVGCRRRDCKKVGKEWRADRVHAREWSKGDQEYTRDLVKAREKSQAKG